MSIQEIGYLNNSTFSATNNQVSVTDATDVFEFNLFATSNINISLDPSFGDADLSLYYDSNFNGFLDINDQLITYSSLAGTADDSINVANRGAGTYFAQVYYYSSNYNTVEYDLDISATQAALPSNLLPQEATLGNLFRDENYTGYINNYNTTDTFSFSLGLYEGVNIELTGLTADADIRLIEDSNGNGIVDVGEVIDVSNNFGTLSEVISTNISGDYFLQVYQYSGNTNYTLDFNYYTTTFV